MSWSGWTTTSPPSGRWPGRPPRRAGPAGRARLPVAGRRLRRGPGPPAPLHPRRPPRGGRDRRPGPRGHPPGQPARPGLVGRGPGRSPGPPHPALVGFYDLVVPAERVLERRLRPGFGQSILCVAQVSRADRPVPERERSAWGVRAGWGRTRQWLRSGGSTVKVVPSPSTLSADSPGPVSVTTIATRPPAASLAGDPDGAGVAVVLDVGGQVEQHLLEALAVGVDHQGRVVRGQGLDGGLALGGQRADRVDGVLDDLEHLHRLPLTATGSPLDAGDVEDLVDQLQQVPAAPQGLGRRSRSAPG